MTIGDVVAQYCWLLLVQSAISSVAESGRDSSQGPAEMGHTLDTCRGLVEEHRGSVHHYVDEGFLAFWPDRADLRATVAQALGRLTTLQRSSPALFRVVLHYGQANVGPADRFGEESLSGSAVNFTLRIDKLARMVKASCLVSEVAQALLTPYLTLGEAAHCGLPGYQGTHTFYQVARA
jgi:class 3 adenylate cyclase